MTNDSVTKVTVGVAALAVASACFCAAIGISKPQVEAKASISSERVATGLHAPVFRKYLAPGGANCQLSSACGF